MSALKTLVQVFAHLPSAGTLVSPASARPRDACVQMQCPSAANGQGNGEEATGAKTTTTESMPGSKHTPDALASATSDAHMALVDTLLIYTMFLEDNPTPARAATRVVFARKFWAYHHPYIGQLTNQSEMLQKHFYVPDDTRDRPRQRNTEVLACGEGLFPISPFDVDPLEMSQWSILTRPYRIHVGEGLMLCYMISMMDYSGYDNFSVSIFLFVASVAMCQ